MDKTFAQYSSGWLFLTAVALCLWGAKGKVYYSCGAVLESMERGLILSPGFPNNYYPGTHCVWQFFIPVRTHLILEILDFDVFESSNETPDPWDGFFSSSKGKNKEMFPTEENSDLPITLATTKSSVLAGMSKATQKHSSPGAQSKGLASHYDGFPVTTSKKEEYKQTSEEKQFSQMEELKEIAKAQPDGLPFTVAGNTTTQRQNISGLEMNRDLKGKVLLAHLTARRRDEVMGESQTLSTTILPRESSTTQQSSVDVCPHDVLYVSDLITFSSRFCGTNLPLNKTMVFSSSLEMVEVIMELITTTDRGRGFAMIFEYKNITEPNVMDVVRQDGQENTMMLAIITGIVFFALVLLSTLCITCRQKMCPKRNPSNAHSDQENGIQNSAIDINELQLVVPTRENENNNHTVSRDQAVTSSGGSTEHSSRHTDPDVPSSMSAMTTETGSDEVFIISAGPGASGLSFTTYRIQDKNLKRSVTSPASVSDWLTSDHVAPGAGTVDKGNTQAENHHPRQRTWSARTFHDLLTPLPQLQKKWYSWTTNSPFTKLVDSSGLSTSTRNQSVTTRKVISATEIEGISDIVYSDSSTSTASYPLTQSAQRQGKLSSSSLKKSRFGNPYFGFLTSSPDCKEVRPLDPSRHVGVTPPLDNQSHGSAGLKSNLINCSKTKELSIEMDKSKPAFVISEEGDDQQPLVLAEHFSQCRDTLSEQNVVYASVKAMPDKQPVVLTVQGDSSARPPNFTLDLPIWEKSPNLYSNHMKTDSSSRGQCSLPSADTNTIESPWNFDSLTAHTLCQTSVQ
ncbi:F-box only protein 6 [Platysternon megacephalum]|uniref:F-box only protein 6 n=1 Tax=Platysternon megacephalum TaxID=55544 RepID=A0A4D9F0I6_9SAUR|nr:F-box only protein 6 [Platysternon megacephalum]